MRSAGGDDEKGGVDQHIVVKEDGAKNRNVLEDRNAQVGHGWPRHTRVVLPQKVGEVGQQQGQHKANSYLVLLQADAAPRYDQRGGGTYNGSCCKAEQHW